MSVAGVGLHSGAPTRVELRPSAPGSGRRFTFSGGGGLAARLEAVEDTQFATTLASPGPDGASQRVRTVEHLLAALVGQGLDDVEIAVEGGEIPALDGSAGPWVELLGEAGAAASAVPRQVMVVEAPVEVRLGGRWARLSPAPCLCLDLRVDYDHVAIGTQHIRVAFDGPEVFSREIAWARTFGFLRDVDALRAAGLARGASLENVVVYGSDGVLNPGGLRASDEPVRHKALDLLGDLALLGCPLRGQLETDLPGHTLSRALMEALLREPKAWRMIEG